MTILPLPIRLSENQGEGDRRQFLASLGREARCHSALHHPWLQTIARGGFPDMGGALRDPTNRREMGMGMREALNLRERFWTQLYRRTNNDLSLSA